MTHFALHARWSIVALSSAFTLFAGCGGGAGGGGSAFSHTFPDDRTDHVEAVVARLAAAPAHGERAVVVLAATDPSRIVAYDLTAGRTLWEEPTELRTIPYIAGDYVVTQESRGGVVRAADEIVFADFEGTNYGQWQVTGEAFGTGPANCQGAQCDEYGAAMFSVQVVP